MQNDFQVGDIVIYGLQGKFQVSSIESKTIQGNNQSFYRLEAVKNIPNRNQKTQSSILVPLGVATRQGMRSPLNTEMENDLNNILSSKEYYISLETPWPVAQIEMDKLVKQEGVMGIAKAYSYLFVLKRKSGLSNEKTKVFESIQKALLREISDHTNETYAEIEERLDQVMKPKLSQDH